MLKTPQFWTKKTVISWLLLPLSLIYIIVYFTINFLRQSNKVSKVVICIGNLTSGGSGKTPVAIAIGKVFNEMGVDFAYLSRGYMANITSKSKFKLLKKNHKENARKIGDEPMLLSEIAPTLVSSNRVLGAKYLAKMKNCSAIILDDGLQNNSLHLDYKILVIDAKIGLGNEFLIPAGPMREPFSCGIKKVNLVVIIGKPKNELLSKLKDKKIIYANIKAVNCDQFKDKKLIAFCGLAYPDKFFTLLEDKNFDIVKRKAYPDHYIYSKNDLTKLCKEAKDNNATLITTKKDWVKFSKNFQQKIAYLDIELEFENKNLVKEELEKLL